MDLHNKILNIKVIILDIDGVMTDGRVGYGDTDEIKFFHVRDGHGIKLAQRAGLKVGVLSGRRAACNRRRAEELKFDFFYEGCKNKLEGFQNLLIDQHFTAEECLYIGDDIVDLPPMRCCGVAVVVNDGVQELDSVATYRTLQKGGHGAIRETIEWLLKGQGKWESIIQSYYC